jgi:sigma-54 dependent transcriptional regulator, acetoin dehydrogenase operon transcriptional activator AcoR
VYPVGSSKPRRVHFRLISACNRPLRNEVAERRFRMDLFYRLSVTSLNIPPLRHRRMDIPELVDHFAESAAAHHGLPQRRFSDEVLRVLMNHSWPGNVRELRNAIETITLLAPGEVVDLASLPDELLAGPAVKRDRVPGVAHAARGVTLGVVEKDAISAAILTRQGNLTQVARDLNISRSTLYLKLKKHALDPVLDEARLGA